MTKLLRGITLSGLLVAPVSSEICRSSTGTFAAKVNLFAGELGKNRHADFSLERQRACCIRDAHIATLTNC
jgi:hypothetical protein